MRLPYRALVFAGAVAAWGASPAEARGKPDGNPGALELIDRLQPGMRGIRMPGEPALGDLGQALAPRLLAPYRFRIEGQADTAGGTHPDQAPPERRAAAMRDDLLARHGISPPGLAAIGLGESQLPVPTAHEAVEPRVRRVRLINLDG